MRPVKLLLDENVSARVAERLRDEGVDAVHVRDRGMTGATDAEVLEKAFEEDRILVTANVGDFERLARARELHGGLVLLEDGGLTREEQAAVLRSGVGAIEREYADGRDLINRVMRIRGDGRACFEESVARSP